MNGLGWLLLIIVFAVNAGMAVLFMRDKKLIAALQEKDDGTSEKNRMLYAIVFVLINLGIALLFCRFYKDNTLLFSLKRFLLLSVLWVVGYIDLKTYKIPNKYILICLISRVVVLVFELLFEREFLLSRIISEGIATAVLLAATLLCSIIIKNSIGYGDIKLFIVMGLMLGIEGIWSAVFVSLVVSFIIAIILLASGKKGRKDIIPFAPSIMIGTYISIILTGM